MIIAPIIFCTVVHGIASMTDKKKLGRLGIKTIVYFEVVSTFALIIGLIVVNVWKPGANFHINPLTLDPTIGKSYAEKGHAQTTADFFLNIIPKSYFDAFATGDILQVLLVSILSAFAVGFMGERGKPVLEFLERGEKVFFGIMHIIVKVAPLAALGAMAFTVGSQGLRALGPLLSLMIGFYATAGIFVVLVLGVIARVAGFFHFYVHQLHQGRDLSGAGHQLLGDGAAGYSARNFGGWAARNRRSVLWFRRVTASIWTGPTST